MLYGKFGDPRLHIKEYLGTGYYVNCHWTNYACKKGRLWDMTKTHSDSSLSL